MEMGMARNTAKNRFRVEGVQQTKNMVAFAKGIEKKLNELVNEGYDVEVHPREQGMLLIGSLQDPVSSSEGASEREPEREMQMHVHRSELSFGAVLLFHRFMESCEQGPGRAFAEDALKKAGTLVRGYNAHQLNAVIGELEKEATTHEKDCRGCALPGLLRAVASAVKETTKHQIQ
jgi:hypothetical protein